MRKYFAVAACVAVMFGGACNRHVNVLDTAAIPTSPTSVINPPPPIVTTVIFQQGVIKAGASIQGMLLLTGPAPDGGVSVSLNASDEAAIVDSSVSIPAGSSRIDFTVGTRVVPTDREVRITASTGGRSTTGGFQVWAEVAEFFQFISETGDFIGGGSFRRMTRATSTFTASCTRNTLDIRVQTGNESWFAMFSGPAGVPLRAGTYEGATRAPFNTATPGLSIFGAGRGCNTLGGRFVIHDIDLQNNRVNRFHASYVQRCDNSSGLLTGEIRIANMPASGAAVTCQR